MRQRGFGLLIVLIFVAFIAFFVIRGLDFFGATEQKAPIEVGIDAIKQAEELKEVIKNRSQKQSELFPE